MGNGNGHNYENDETRELSPLLLVPIEDAKNAKNSRGRKCFVALLLLLAVSATAAAAAMTVLVHGSLSAGGTPIASVFSSLMGTGRKKGESCDNIWWNACGDKLSCYDNGYKQYCVPMGEVNACCGWWHNKEAAGIDCGKGLECDNRSSKAALAIITHTCHPMNENSERDSPASFAKKGSCNVNTGKPANILIRVTNFI